MKKYFFYLTTIIIIMTGCANKTTTKETTMTDQLDSLFTEIFPNDGPGGAVIITQGHSMIYGRGFGLADLETNQKVDLNTMFNICSVSKQFSAVALMKLAEEGKLSLDDPVTKYFPNLKAPFFNDITLRHLMSHTSGIPDARPRNAEEWTKYRKHHDSRFENVEDFKLYCEEDESLRYLESLDSFNFAPGTAYEYMNPTFQMMLSIVEQASGQQFDEWMRENIFVPAGMPSTVYFEPERAIPDMAHGYERNEAGEWKESDYGEASFFGTKADGGIYTTPLEFVNWDKALYHDKVMSPESREMAHTSKIATDIPYTGYGYGWFIEEKPGAPKKIYHTGDNGGFFIYEGRIPDRDLFYLVFATHPHWDREKTAEKIEEILIFD